MEGLMVKNGATGLVVKNQAEYVKALENLYQDQELRNRLSQNAKQYATVNYSINLMERQWNEIFEQLLALPKTTKHWRLDKTNEKISAKDIFIESLGEYGQPFAAYCRADSDQAKASAIDGIRELAKSANWRSATKSTVHQYYAFFPDDEVLAYWSSLMKLLNLWIK